MFLAFKKFVRKFNFLLFIDWRIFQAVADLPRLLLFVVEKGSVLFVLRGSLTVGFEVRIGIEMVLLIEKEELLEFLLVLMKDLIGSNFLHEKSLITLMVMGDGLFKSRVELINLKFHGSVFSS